MHHRQSHHHHQNQNQNQNQNQKSLTHMKWRPVRNLKGIHRVVLQKMSACDIHLCLNAKRSQH